MFVALTGTADAHQSPAGCQGNGMTLDLARDQSPVRPGDTLRYTVAVANSGPFACDVTGASVRLTLPARDGSPTGQAVTLASGLDLPAGAPARLLGTVPYSVAVDPGVTAIVARADVQGTLHGAGVDDLATMSRSVGTQVDQTSSSVPATGEVGGTVPATLALTLSGPATLGTFVPGVAKDYSTSTAATVTSTAGDAALAVSDPGHLANGTFALPSPLQVTLGRSSWTGPVSNDPVTITFTQHIGATDPLRTGTYSKTLTFTLATASP